ncbi:hypothetical protein Q8A73_017271 [Channa argus]|nr:hypothetical protein Q8A73_017271 [Channa argus]
MGGVACMWGVHKPQPCAMVVSARLNNLSQGAGPRSLLHPHPDVREGERSGGVRVTAVSPSLSLFTRPLANEQQTPGGFSDYLTHCVHFWEGDHLHELSTSNSVPALSSVVEGMDGCEQPQHGYCVAQARGWVGLREMTKPIGTRADLQQQMGGGECHRSSLQHSRSPAEREPVSAEAWRRECSGAIVVTASLGEGSTERQGLYLRSWTLAVKTREDEFNKGLVYFTHIKDHMPQFHSTAGRTAPIPDPDWPVMGGVDSYKPSTKWSNTKGSRITHSWLGEVKRYQLERGVNKREVPAPPPPPLLSLSLSHEDRRGHTSSAPN